MTNREIADLLEQVGTALELVSDNPFKARAYYSAARTIAACQDSVYDLAEQGKATTIKGVGASVGEAINDIVKNGSPTILEELLGEIPPDVWRMLSLPGLGPKRVRSIWRSLSITTLDELEQAC
ncbi:MAG: histidinol-phosphatase, partial [Bacillota bacterium]